MEAPAEDDLHGDCKGGLEGLVGQLHPLGGDHEAFVVSGGATWISTLLKFSFSWLKRPNPMLVQSMKTIEFLE